MSNLKKHSAFTLVELIVVIVILAILATIAFLSFSSQSASARDSTRLSDMNNIAKGLSVFSASSGTLPKPDNNISILASGTTIGYQGYAGANVLNMIKISNGGKDPLDTTTYYTYSTNAAQSKFQILGFLEDGSSSALSLSPDFARFGFKETFADPASYSGRYVMTKGDMLGILLSSGSLVPIQTLYTTSFTGADVVNNNGYVAQFSNNLSVNGSGQSLITAFATYNKTLSSYDPNLVGYWDMETLSSDGRLKDLSGKGNDGTMNGTVSVQGKIGKAKEFNGISDFIDAGNGSSLNVGTNDFSMCFWINKSSITSRDEEIAISKGLGGYSLGWAFYVKRDSSYIEFWPYYDATLRLQYFSAGSYTAIGDGKWHNVCLVEDRDVKGTLFIDSKTYLTTTAIGTGNLSNSVPFKIGGLSGSYLKGSLDEIKVYNRMLSDTEISALYNSAK